MNRTWKRSLSLLLAMALWVLMVPLGASAAEPENYVYQWGNGSESYSLLNTRETLGGGESGVTQETTFRDAARSQAGTAPCTPSSPPGRKPAMTPSTKSP